MFSGFWGFLLTEMLKVLRSFLKEQGLRGEE